MSRERSRFIPEVPTALELGFPRVMASNWYGLIAPAGTPLPIVERLHREVAGIVAERDFVERVEKLGLTPSVVPPERMRSMIRSEGAAWAAVVRAANIKVE